MNRWLACLASFLLLAFFLSCCPCRNAPSASEVRQRWVNGPSGKLWVEEQGGGAGLPVILVHGLGADHQVWRAQVEALAPARRVVTMDLHGMGLSEPSATGDYTIPSFADDVLAVARALKLKRFVLVGHSMGGLVIAEAASKAPKQVAALLFADPAGDLTQIPKAGADAWLNSFEPASYEKFREEWFGEMLAQAKTPVREQVLSTLRRTPREVVSGAAHGLFAYDPKPALASFKGPMTSVVTPANQEPYSLHKVQPAIGPVLMTGVSHWLMMDDPEAFNATMLQFLQECQ